MNMQSSSTLLKTLKSMLHEDISTLDLMIGRRLPDSKMYQLLRSLMKAKKRILDIIPSDAQRIAVEPTLTKVNTTVVDYNQVKTPEIQDQSKLIKILKKIEEDQLQYIESVDKDLLLTRPIKSKIDNITDVYRTIISELNQMLESKQIGIIAL